LGLPILPIIKIRWAPKSQENGSDRTKTDALPYLISIIIDVCCGRSVCRLWSSGFG